MQTPSSALACREVGNPANGGVMVIGDSRVGSTATYTCDEGYILTRGSETRVCREDQTWTGTMPTCGKSVQAIATNLSS